jgi:hypothetical protein
MWGDLYKTQPSFVLGFHGCDAAVAEEVFAGRAVLKPSSNKHDWLGDGIYFWESSPQRAMQWAEELVTRRKRSKGHVIQPAVVGAILDLGLCCSLFDQAALDELGQAWHSMHLAMDAQGQPMPENKGGAPDYPLRHLDRAVIESMCAIREANGLDQYDTVRGAFPEGGALFDGGGISARNHIQIAVRNPAMIKGYFRPIPAAAP